MARTLSTMLALGTVAPDFALTDTQAKTVKRRDFSGKPLLVIFMCNHCPYVNHIGAKLALLSKNYMEKAVAVVGINSNDAANYPDDSPAKMIEEVKLMKYNFPYLYDADQAVAKKYRAACTPDFFLFDSEHKLVYRGQFDNSRPSNDVPVTGEDLNRAVDAVVNKIAIPGEQKPSMGCNIKWKAGNEPDYFG
jgi:peroxiredoxin